MIPIKKLVFAALEGVLILVEVVLVSWMSQDQHTIYRVRHEAV